ncbi:TonB-dependent receptor [Eudoraea adriatica]|uniref:TonB-dependent receptor n=1 Tax=Eudoraea adriatica TaxID=446681 RepID=UPI000360C2BC|nr:TonB-dependent receptor [Eudoraea adriatica]
MPKTRRNSILLFYLILLLALFSSRAQVKSFPKNISLVSYIRQLEKDFDVKFSYVDEDLQPLLVDTPEAGSLEAILDNIRNQTQLIIKKLSNRYYTLSKSTTVDICAYVLDNYSENSAPGASVEVLGSSISTVTDANGRFTLDNIPRKASIRIKHLGFKPKYVTAEDLVSKNPCSKLLFNLNYQQLDEVVVFKFLTTGLTKQTDGSITVNTEDFGILPGLLEPDVLQTVQALPGIKSIDETVSDINIRGGTNDQNLILWDDIKMYQSGHFFGLISAFNPYLTEHVTIIKDGTSAEYGDGVSGIISMQSKNKIEGNFFGGAGFNMISADVHGQVPISEKLAFQFSARRSITDLVNTPTYNQFVKRAFQDTDVEDVSGQSSDTNINQDETFYFYDFTAKVLYDINEQHKARFSFININNNLDYTETAVNLARTDQSNLNQTNLSFGGTLESIWTDRFSTKLNAYYSNYNLDSENRINNGQQILDQRNEVIETSVKLNTNYQLNTNLNWLNGYQFSEVGISNFTDVTQPPFESNIKGVIRTNSIYSEISYASPNKKLVARGGGRLNYIVNVQYFDEFIVEPRLNLSYSLYPNLQLEVKGEFKNQTTNQIIDLEQNFLGIEKRRWMLSNNKNDTIPGNPNLPVVKSKQGSLGLNYDKGRWFVGLEGYYKEVDGISTVTQGFQNQNQFNGEIGKYDVKGLEFLINYKNSYFSTWFSYAYNLNNYTFEDIVPNVFPNNLDIRHTITFAGTYTYKNLKLGVGINYRTGKPFTEPIDGLDSVDFTTFPVSIIYKEPNSSRLPDYVRADASAIYNFNISNGVKATAGVSILNIFNKENILNTYYKLNDRDEIVTIENVSLGFTPNLSFRVSF